MTIEPMSMTNCNILRRNALRQLPLPALQLTPLNGFMRVMLVPGVTLLLGFGLLIDPWLLPVGDRFWPLVGDIFAAPTHLNGPP